MVYTHLLLKLYDMLSAYVLMIISVVLMFTGFVVLRFTIGFTISEEFHEIGVMKAVGIDNNSIRSLYIVKYLAIAVIGTLIGYFCSIPLGDILSTAVLMPINNVMMNWVGNMIGDISGLKCDFDPLEIFVICPGILIGVTVIGSYLTALYTKTIKASDTASIE